MGSELFVTERGEGPVVLAVPSPRAFPPCSPTFPALLRGSCSSYSSPLPEQMFPCSSRGLGRNCYPRCLPAVPDSSIVIGMFVVSEADAAAIRTVYEQDGECRLPLSCVAGFRVSPITPKARECTHTIAGWPCSRPRLCRALAAAKRDAEVEAQTKAGRQKREAPRTQQVIVGLPLSAGGLAYARFRAVYHGRVL